MWLFGIAIVIACASAAPVDVNPECAACQLFTIALEKKLNSGDGAFKSPSSRCTHLPHCQDLTHCEIVQSLMQVSTHNITSALRPQFDKVRSFLDEVARHCEKEPHAAVLDNKPGPALCTLCFLIYYFFQFLNNGILQMPLLQIVPDVIKLTCMVVMNLPFDDDKTPPVCQALLADGALPALLKAIADSMGSFYNLIAVQMMGCPTYQTLFGIC
ncbi:unnamed protein product [Cylicocyclus nassatus]|uniref:Saposin B-type domain-containing protein n=1 Tax=Cylicocyclus nassatus TaxID=53992 RepID=A0AA36M7T8_CYLNA|nr:unnamed protein product [Cylicocyclus nassatus]